MAEAPPAAAAPAGTPPAAGAVTPPRSKKMLIIIVAAVVALGAAGAGAYFFLGHKGGEETAQDADSKPVKGAKGAKADKGKKSKKEVEPKGPAVYVKLEPPFVVNFEAQGVMRFLQVTVEVLTRDTHVADLVKANDPQIRNDLLLLFGAQQAPDLKTNEGKEKLRKDARDVVAKIVTSEGGEGKKVENIYFTSFVMQ